MSRASERGATVRTARVFTALGDEARLRILRRLSGEGPLSIVRLSEGSGMTRQATRKHLRVLDRAGLVRSSRRGRESLWSLEARRLAEARSALEAISQEWDQRLARLRAWVEG